MADVYEPSFTAEDHTKLITAVMDRPLHVIRYLSLPPGQSPTTHEVLEAALKVQAFDPATKARLQAAADALVIFEEERQRDEAAFKERQDRVRAALDGKSVAGMITALDDLLSREQLDARSAEGLKFARDILKDGSATIYSTENPFYELFPEAKPAGVNASAAAPAAGHTTGAQQVAQVDAEFASHGGGGSIPGAVAGAASLGAAVGVIYDAFFA